MPNKLFNGSYLFDIAPVANQESYRRVFVSVVYFFNTP